MTQERDIVLGLGATGYSVVRHLHAKNPLAVFDTRLEKESSAIPFLSNMLSEFPDVEVLSPRSYRRSLLNTRRVVVSPGIPLSNSMVKWAQQARIPVLGDIDLFMEQVEVPVIAITGTNGKSSTVCMVADMLQKQGFIACGNIGTPVLDVLESNAAGYVLELSSFQLERLHHGPFNVATILNISADHLDHHGSLEEYIVAKQRIYQQAKFVVYDQLRPETIPQNREIPGIELNCDPNWTVQDRGIIVNGKFLHKDDIALNSVHNLENLLFAAAISTQFGATFDDVARVAQSFVGAPHTAQSIGFFDGVEYINDSKATNIGATITAIQTQYAAGSNLVLICGGDGKGVDFPELGKCIDDYVSHAILMGRDRQGIASCIQRTSIEFVGSIGAAVSAARKFAQTGDKVLLAPACASLDIFKDYAHRGDSFEQKVLELNG